MTQTYPKEWRNVQEAMFEKAADYILHALKSSTISLTGPDDKLQHVLVEGRKDTPKRFASMMMEMLEGELYTNDEIVDLFKDKVFTEHTTHSILCKFDKIKTFSFCEHHLALMYDLTITIEIDYNKVKNKKVKVIGLSKIPRICELVCKRLQLQERIATDIHYIVTKLLGLPLTVTIEGKHSCVSARGVKKDMIFTSQVNS